MTKVQRSPMDKTPPHDDAAETAVIGCVLVTPGAVVEVGELYSNDFFSVQCAEAWTAIQSLARDSEPIDIVTVGRRLKESGSENKFPGGWGPWAVQISSNVPTVHNVSHYAEIVRDHAILRRLIVLSTETLNRCYSGVKAATVIADVSSSMAELQVRSASRDPVVMADAIPGAIETISKRCDPSNKHVLVRTGFAAFDDHVGGLAPEELIIVGARPGVGKTSWSNAVAQYASQVQGIPVLQFSVEMSQQQQMERFIAMETGLSATSFRSGRLDGRPLTMDHHRQILKAGEKLSQAAMWIDAEAKTLGRILAVSRRWHARHVVAVGMTICLVVVDYLQLVGVEMQDNPIPREQQVAMLSKSFKWLSKELHCPVLVNCQLNRKIEERGGEPVLSDLRESGAIEQDADMVLFLHRSGENSSVNVDVERAWLIAGKNRNGPVGKYALGFHGKSTRFVSGTDDDDGARDAQVSGQHWTDS